MKTHQGCPEVILQLQTTRGYQIAIQWPTAKLARAAHAVLSTLDIMPGSNQPGLAVCTPQKNVSYMTGSAAVITRQSKRSLSAPDPCTILCAPASVITAADTRAFQATCWVPKSSPPWQGVLAHAHSHSHILACSTTWLCAACSVSPVYSVIGTGALPVQRTPPALLKFFRLVIFICHSGVPSIQTRPGNATAEGLRPLSASVCCSAHEKQLTLSIYLLSLIHHGTGYSKVGYQSTLCCFRVC